MVGWMTMYLVSLVIFLLWFNESLEKTISFEGQVSFTAKSSNIVAATLPNSLS